MPTISDKETEITENNFVCRGKPGVAVAVNNHNSTKCHSLNTCKSNAPHHVSRCPHVCLIGDIYIEDLEIASQIELQKRKRRAHRIRQISEDNDNNQQLVNDNEDDDEDNQFLTCEECDQRRSLWICLRENCMYVGCGQDNSKQHSTTHAQLMHHPLSMNLTNKSVWCELCCCKVTLEQNDPQYRFKTRQKNNNSNHKYINNHKLNNSSIMFEYAYQQMLLINNSENSTKNQEDYDLVEYVDQDIDPNREAYERKQQSSDSNYEDLPIVRNGLIGLDNIGNTCYMNSALQALSNCLAFTSFFLECSQFIDMTVSSNSTTSSSPCLSQSYMKLMREIWQKNNSKSKRQKNMIINSITPNDLVHTIRYFNSMFRGYMQHDSQEFLIYLLDQLHEELKRPVLAFQNTKKTPNTSDDEDRTVVQQETNGKSKNRRLKENYDDDDGDDSDSYETCGGGDSLAASSDLSEKLHFSDVEESPQSSMSVERENVQDDRIDEDFSSQKAIMSSSSNITDSGISTTPSSLSNQQKVEANNNETILETELEKRKMKRREIKKQDESSDKRQKREQQNETKPTFTSIISELFDGKIIGQVQCLECKHLSTTTETFQHLSLPIPTKEYLQALHTKVVERQNETLNGNKNEENFSNDMTNNIRGDSSVPYQSWLSWMFDLMKGYIWSPTIKLSECLTAFFSDDDLQGDNMYSCDKCKKLTNGVKYSKVYDLPEILCIHLKRFRHDSMFGGGTGSSTKVNTYVSFPIDSLDMSPFVHKECKNECNTYDLCSIICHYGSSNGGHYTCFGRNYADEEWYEYDDNNCRQVDTLMIQNAQAYVLFYKKKNLKMDNIKEELRNIICNHSKDGMNGFHDDQDLLSSNPVHFDDSKRSYFISKQWLHRFKYFAEPGKIDNSDFLCKHNFVYPHIWPKIESLTLQCSAATWQFLVKHYGVKYDLSDSDSDDEESISSSSSTNSISSWQHNSAGIRPKTECTFLYPCSQCQHDDEMLKQRQIYELNEYLKLREKYRAQQFQLYQSMSKSVPQIPQKTYAISSSWFKTWEQFVQSKQKLLKSLVIPGKINNYSICINTNKNSKTHVLNKNSNYGKISEEMWNFLHGIYGGGPVLLINGTNLASTKSRSTRSPKCSISSLSLSTQNSEPNE